MNKMILYGGIGILAIVATLLTAGVAFAGNGNANQAGAQKVSWQLSGAVMPVPPYGSGDIIGSDTASKLIVNRPNGAVETTITGVMGGLEPYTMYTVYISNPYVPYIYTGWNLAGSWVIGFMCSASSGCGGPYNHDMVLSQSGTSLSGSGGYPVGGPYTYTWTITSGSVTGNTVHLTMDYITGASCTMTMDGTIASDGTMSGTWSDSCSGGRTGTWSSTDGAAVATHTGDTGWTGLFTSGVQPFTFTTDSTGTGSWHVNLRAGDITGPYASVWINGGGKTVLISDNFQVG